MRGKERIPRRSFLVPQVNLFLGAPDLIFSFLSNALLANMRFILSFSTSRASVCLPVTSGSHGRSDSKEFYPRDRPAGILFPFLLSSRARDDRDWKKNP